ncbi:NAD-dependent epimerase/dehydratase family protein [Lentisphaerota bacterium ZTH]|nr:NAD-dependent epimerase/dehydratase family protein [Lentisphaerota bacterium]WET06353.1 NAD-dependent epimerase/dehydratase family protein [Lentisphaerota bacterium ZTH]
MSSIIKVGITGRQGFIGTHLYNYLSTYENFELIPFEKDFFVDEDKLKGFVCACDAIVHLAAVSRHDDQDYLYNTNMELVEDLITAMEETGVEPHVIFASTTHEPHGNDYHMSKHDGRLMIDDWAAGSGGKSTGLFIPNTFGPGSRPFFNSFVSTFCFQTAIGETPELINDAVVELIYIKDLCEEIRQLLTGDINANPYTPPYTAAVKVSAVLKTLQRFKNELDTGKISRPGDYFEECLYETFQSYLPAG